MLLIKQVYVYSEALSFPGTLLNVLLTFADISFFFLKDSMPYNKVLSLKMTLQTPSSEELCMLSNHAGCL